MDSQERGKHSEKGKLEDFKKARQKWLLDQLEEKLKKHSPEELDSWRDHLNAEKDRESDHDRSNPESDSGEQ